MYLSEVFGAPLGDPLGGRFSSRRLSVLLSLIVLPLNLSPSVSVCLRLSTFARVCLRLLAFSPLHLLAFVSICLLFWESAKVSHKRVFALLTPEIHSYEMAQMLQKPVFALPGCQRTSVNTLLCDTLALADFCLRLLAFACAPLCCTPLCVTL